jgi:cyclohexanone monooxygenase
MSLTTDRPESSERAFNPDALRDKYQQERDKRLRDDGNDQYLEVTGQFADYVDDPYVEPGFTRAPLTDEVDVIVVGGGFGGLLAGARLKDAGVTDVRIIEKAGDFGGTWYWNRYPGAACDVESYVYLPLLEEIGYMPKEKYSHAAEILAHSQAIGRKYDLYDNACFQTQITDMRWDDKTTRWIVRTNRNDEMKARFVCLASGPLNRPKLPGIPGIESFKGHTFHTSRWDYDYTKGDALGNLTGLKGKRVGIIGTGATAVQCVPHVGEMAEHFYVFQRTPSSVDVKTNGPTDQDWVKSLEPGWHQNRMNNFNTLVSGGFAEEDLVNDGWTDIIRNLLLRFRDSDASVSHDEVQSVMELADFEKMEQVRGRVDEVVGDADTAEALKPYYRQFCKRPCFHNEYLETFNRPNVTLVDTQGQGVERITEKGVVVNGKEYDVDCLIYATGFEVGTDYTRRAGFELCGRDGQTMTDKWKKGVATLHGIHTHGFPNCFVMGGAQAGFTVNYPHNLNEQSKHIAYIIDRAMDSQVRSLEASQAAEDGWVQTIVEKAVLRRTFFEECTPGYYNNEGKPGERSGQNSFYGGGPDEYFGILDKWREDGKLEGLELNK